MSLDTVLQIGRTISQGEDSLRYHRFFNSIEDEIEKNKHNKDAQGNSIETIVYELPVRENFKKEFEFAFDELKKLTDESKIRSLLYLNFKTSDKDSDKKYLFGDIIYSSFKNKKGETKLNGNYRLKEGKKDGSFKRCSEDAKDLNESIIGKFRGCFEKHLETIENDILKRHSAIVIHFAFENQKAWHQEEEIMKLLKAKLLDAFVVEIEIEGRKVYALNKTLFKTIKPPVWDKESKTFKDPDGVGGVTPGFLNKNTFKLRAFLNSDDIWNLMFAIDFAERPLIRIKDIGIVILPKGNSLSKDDFLGFFKKSNNAEKESQNEEALVVSNLNASTEWDSLFEPTINNSFSDQVEFDVIFLKPKAGSSPAVDMIELASIKKSHLKEVHERIRKIKTELQEVFNKVYPNAKKSFHFDLRDNFLAILTNKTKSEKKYQFHLLKALPQIYLDAYFEDPVLLPAFIERTEWNIRNEEQFSYSWFRYNFLFLSKIQKNEPLMQITNSGSYAIGRYLGIMARPFAAWRDDCPIKTFEKNYVGNLTRRIAYKEDVIKFYNFLNEKLAIHEKFYPAQQEASRQLAKELQNFTSAKYNKNECAFGFFESYFEKQEAAKPAP